MFDSIKNFFLTGDFWLTFSKEEAVGKGKYKFTVSNYSALGIISNLLTIGKVYTYGEYTFDILNIEKTDTGKTLLTVNTTKAPDPEQAGALGWGILLGAIGAVLLLNSIEKIEKLVDTTAVRTIQILVALVILFLLWKYKNKKS